MEFFNIINLSITFFNYCNLQIFYTTGFLVVLHERTINFGPFKKVAFERREKNSTIGSGHIDLFLGIK